MEKLIDTGAIHSLVTKREDAFQKYLHAREEYDKVCSDLREKINSLAQQTEKNGAK